MRSRYSATARSSSGMPRANTTPDCAFTTIWRPSPAPKIACRRSRKVLPEIRLAHGVDDRARGLASARRRRRRDDACVVAHRGAVGVSVWRHLPRAHPRARGAAADQVQVVDLEHAALQRGRQHDVAGRPRAGSRSRRHRERCRAFAPPSLASSVSETRPVTSGCTIRLRLVPSTRPMKNSRASASITLRSKRSSLCAAGGRTSGFAANGAAVGPVRRRSRRRRCLGHDAAIVGAAIRAAAASAHAVSPAE